MRNRFLVGLAISVVSIILLVRSPRRIEGRPPDRLGAAARLARDRRPGPDRQRLDFGLHAGLPAPGDLPGIRLARDLAASGGDVSFEIPPAALRAHDLEFAAGLFATVLYIVDPAYSALYPFALAFAFFAFAMTRRIGMRRLLLSRRALDERETALIALALTKLLKVFLYQNEATRPLYVDIVFYVRPLSYATAFFLFNSIVGLLGIRAASSRSRRGR
jgi:hypothetical protein